MDVLEEFAKLIQDCAEGIPQAQARLYELFSAKMYAVCLRYAKDIFEAQDNLQEGFYKVFTKIKTYRGEGSLEGWIKKIMVNVSLEKYRKKNLYQSVEDLNVYSQVLRQDDGIIDSISANDLLLLIQELPPRYRMVFNLYVIEGFPHHQIAKMMNITESTSKSNLARARVIMQKKVLEKFGEEEGRYAL